jgi:hypothetical protein
MLTITQRLDGVCLVLGICTLSCGTQSLSAQNRPASSIVGRITDCWGSDQRRRVPNVRVYVFEKTKAGEITQQWSKIRSKAGDPDSEPTLEKVLELEQLQARFEELVMSKVKPVKPFVVSDNGGHYNVSGLSPKASYTVVAIHPQLEDQAAYFELMTLESLAHGPVRLDLDFSKRRGCPFSPKP